MHKLVNLNAYHRVISTHNPNEISQVKESREIWGGESKVLAHGVCVQAFPERHEPGIGAYSFGTKVTAVAYFGFFNRKMIIREVRWKPDMAGVEERKQGKYACIAIDRIDE